MGDVIVLKLEANDLGQVLDGLRCRASAWRETEAFLRSGEVAGEFFVPEECRDAEEAGSIAADYERIIGEIVRQREELASQSKQRCGKSRRGIPTFGTRQEAEASLRSPKSSRTTTRTGTRTIGGFGIFIDTVAEGEVPLWRDGDGKPCFFATHREAERVIIEDVMARLQECLDGGREYEDAMTVEEYILPVERLADGSLTDERGRLFA